ncbi:MAG: ribonuclease III [Anaerolineales bacterium]|nr:ribonuclease III [Anaerolineales bacterium]
MEPAQGYPVESPANFAHRNNLPFKDISYLSRALTHRSYMNENTDAVEDNERLEFLGDAVLDFLVAAWLYNRYPEMNEGVLTSYRSALVGGPQLAAFGHQWNVGGAMRLGRGEDEGGGRKRERLVSSTYEAIIGALYLDAGLDVVKTIVYPMLEPAIEQIVAKNNDQDPKSRLQEWSQSHGMGIPHYRQVSVSGPDHDRKFEFEVTINGQVYGRGTGSSKHAASKDAARNALISLGLE